MTIVRKQPLCGKTVRVSVNDFLKRFAERGPRFDFECIERLMLGVFRWRTLASHGKVIVLKSELNRIIAKLNLPSPSEN